MTIFTPQANGDRLLYITPDNVQYMMSPPLFVLQEDGFGMPPIEYVTQRGPFQHGETVKNFFLRPRTLQIVVRRSGCSRAEYWNIRAALLDILRPGRQSPTQPGTLRKFMSNGAVRDLSVFCSEGPGFPSHTNETWDEWAVSDTIRFTAYDPIMRDPAVKSATFASSGAVVATFPITFPYQSNTSFSANSTAINSGTWDTSPNLTITGPITGPAVRNLSTGEVIALNYTIPSGMFATIDLTYGQKTVIQSDGTNLMGYVTTDSDLGTFHLQPGINNIQVFGTGTTIGSAILLAWYNRYIGA